ncbi:MAG: DUF4065 domain-containing protein [Candidatus Cloacimonetes bacterium]|nr:DUF4065 domain-containing protein [Candidatus Cloacimonadota bacterium]
MSFLPPENFESGKSCWHCIHFKTEYFTHDGLKEYKLHCTAFPLPDGIPSEVYHNGHDTPRPDLKQQNDIIYEADEEKLKDFKKLHNEIAQKNKTFKKKITCFDVANYFLVCQDEDAGEFMSHLKLQKLVYFAQGFYLAIFNKPLFDELIHAWDHGPVCTKIYNKFDKYKKKPLPLPDIDVFSVFTPEQHQVLDIVLNRYRKFSAWELRNITHSEGPWKKTYSKARNSEISQSDMQDFFTTLLTDDEKALFLYL